MNAQVTRLPSIYNLKNTKKIKKKKNSKIILYSFLSILRNNVLMIYVYM